LDSSKIIDFIEETNDNENPNEGIFILSFSHSFIIVFNAGRLTSQGEKTQLARQSDADGNRLT